MVAFSIITGSLWVHCGCGKWWSYLKECIFCQIKIQWIYKLLESDDIALLWRCFGSYCTVWLINLSIWLIDRYCATAAHCKWTLTNTFFRAWRVLQTWRRVLVRRTSRWLSPWMARTWRLPSPPPRQPFFDLLQPPKSQIDASPVSNVQLDDEKLKMWIRAR